MKIQLNLRPAGNAMLLALFTAFVVSLTLASYLCLVSNQNQTVFRSMSWNASIPVVEAGVEEAMTHLHYSGSVNLASDGWGAIGADGFSHKTGDMGKGFTYDVGIRPPAAGAGDVPTIECLGYSLAPVNYASYYQSTFGMILGGLVPQLSSDKPISKRKVRVAARRQAPVQYPMLADHIDLNGNNISTDSFDSTDARYSGVGGKYVAGLSRDNGGVASNSGIVNTINVGNADIRGHSATGPGGSVAIGSNGAIGDKNWVSTHTGIEPGWVTDDLNIEIPPVSTPFAVANATAQANAQYDIIVTNGNYIVDNFHGRVLVTGVANVLVTSSFKFSGSDGISISPGASLAVYVACATASLGGNGVQNTGDAMTFIYYGLPSNTSLSFGGNATFTGVIYAPSADFSLGGSGSGDYDFIGASISKTVTMTGHFHFHYDESLARRFPIGEYKIFSWNEIDPNSSN